MLLRTVLWVTLAVPTTIAFFGATLPPGVLWSGESRAYDVLEYHLEAPREFYDAGRIHFLPHNVYASFPQQMEMLYLLLMHLGGGPLAGAIPAQLLHALCGVLAVIALAAWTPAGWPRAIVAVGAGTTPWLAYVGCLAYVELGVLLSAAVAAGLALDQFRPGVRSDWRTTLAAGVCAGLAGGCKYTALVLVGVALAAACLGALRGSLLHRVKWVALFACGGAFAFSPWMIRNAAFTGNPVYPFAYRWFAGAAWSAEQDEQWSRGHHMPAAQDSLTGHVRLAVDELFASRMFGPTLFILALAGLVLARSRAAAMLGIWTGLVVVGWATLTYMPGRFAISIVVPLALLAGLAVETCTVPAPVSPDDLRRKRLATGVLASLTLLGGLASGATLASRLRVDSARWQQFGAWLRDLPGQIDLLGDAQPLNRIVPADARVWLIGDAAVFYLRPHVHYTVVFSRDPWLAFARDATPEQAVAWLRTQNVSHVVFSWAEIGRLQRTYGFPEWVTPEWVQTRAAAGLRRMELPPDVRRGLGRDVDIYEVEQK